MSKSGAHVVPSIAGHWSVRKSDMTRASKLFATQTDAVEYARYLVKKSGGDLIIHRKDGTIRGFSTLSPERAVAKEVSGQVKAARLAHGSNTAIVRTRSRAKK